MSVIVKRFWLFSGDDYHPLGGMRDFRGAFDSINDAEVEFAKFGINNEWAHIVDTLTMEIIREQDGELWADYA